MSTNKIGNQIKLAQFIEDSEKISGLKYCCDSFEQDCKVHHKARPNIRIVKIDVIKVPQIDKKYPYRFYLTIGYDKKEKNVASRSFKFCPYCGENLYKFYRKDDYVNEDDHTFLYH